WEEDVASEASMIRADDPLFRLHGRGCQAWRQRLARSLENSMPAASTDGRPATSRAKRPSLARDELSLNRLSIPFVPAEAGTQFFGRILRPWVPASAGTNGDWFNGGANLNSS